QPSALALYFNRVNANRFAVFLRDIVYIFMTHDVQKCPLVYSFAQISIALQSETFSFFTAWSKHQLADVVPVWVLYKHAVSLHFTCSSSSTLKSHSTRFRLPSRFLCIVATAPLV